MSVTPWTSPHVISCVSASLKAVVGSVTAVAQLRKFYNDNIVERIMLSGTLLPVGEQTPL